MLSLAILIGCISVVGGQSALELLANAATHSSSANAIGIGASTGTVDGFVETLAAPGTAFAQSVVTATSGGKYKDDDKYKPYPPKKDDYKKDDYKPKPYPKKDDYKPKPHHKAYPYPVPKKHYDDYKPKCEDYKDDKCYYIGEYDHCGYCIEKKYPLKGYACKYVEEKVKKAGTSKKAYDDYEIIYKPLCDCKGDFILKKEYCPSCDYLLKELLECAGIKDPKKEAYEISEKCIIAVGVTPDYLEHCGYIKPHSSSSKKVKDEPKVIVVKPDIKKKEEPKVVVHKPEKDGKKKDSVAVASASAVAVAGAGGH